MMVRRGPGRFLGALGLLACATVLVTGCAGPPAAVDPSTVPHPRGATAVPMAASNARPPADGYFELKPVGSFPNLPNDAQAAAMVHRSTWEARPENVQANHTLAPPNSRPGGYGGMQNGAVVFGRITGNFTGTTDEIIQWAAAKWGLPDELIRGEAAAESNWYQALKDDAGQPINQRGYGDFGDCGGSPTGSPYGTRGPSSFGIMQVKWCSFENPGSGGTGGWPSTERSTAFDLDVYGAVVRGCYEGYDTWLGNGYQAGDLYGCVGRWFAGDWHSPTAQAYIGRVQDAVNAKPWLNW